MGVTPAKRARLEAEYLASVQNAHHHQQLQQQHQHQQQQQQKNDRVEVIKLPATITSNGSMNLSKPSESQSKDANHSDSANEWSGFNLSSKMSTTSSTGDDGEAPLNLCMKASSEGKGNDLSNSLQSLSSITAALGSGSGSDRMGTYLFLYD